MVKYFTVTAAAFWLPETAFLKKRVLEWTPFGRGHMVAGVDSESDDVIAPSQKRGMQRHKRWLRAELSLCCAVTPATRRSFLVVSSINCFIFLFRVRGAALLLPGALTTASPATKLH